MDIQGSALFSIGDSIFMNIHRGVFCSIGAAKRIPLWRYHRRCSLWWGAHFASLTELGFHGRRLLSPESFPKNWVVLGPKSSLCPAASMQRRPLACNSLWATPLRMFLYSFFLKIGTRS